MIGADGVHSIIRGAVVTPGPAQYSDAAHSALWYQQSRHPSSRGGLFIPLWLGPDHHLVHYPVSAGRKINIVAFAPARDFRA